MAGGSAAATWQAREHRGAELVNEPGTWNFSELNTRDVEGAKAFYGAVFGWEGDESGMWRLPGAAFTASKFTPSG